ncbi:hypothetical protein RugamoR64_56990 [Duganella rhizosphaerae]|uniref:DUF4214 domain-containing protein n=1 Tax=Duganella rhizosphaerae TaxID=2885763 RepID=UPI0030EAE0F0
MSDTDDYSSNPSTTGTLAVGGTALGTFEYQPDFDWFKIHLDAGTTYVFAMTSAPGSYANLNTAVLRLYDAHNTMLTDWSMGGNDSGPAIQYTPTAGGDYFVSAEYYLYGTGLGPANVHYAVSAAIQQADSLSADIHTTGVLAPGGTVTGRFDVAGDVDWYKFHAEAGQHYIFTYPKNAVLPTVFGIYDVNGKQLADGYDPLELTTSGDYFIAVGGNIVGDYSLRAVNIVDDYSTNNSSAGVLTPGGQATGKLEYAFDQDRFNIQLTAGKIYTLDLSGDPRDEDILHFSVLDDQGKQIADSQSSFDGVNAQTLTFTATASATYSVIVSVDNYQHAGRGPYTIKASNPVPDDYGDTAASATQLTLGSPIEGSINFQSDVDVVKVALQAGTTYLLTLNAAPALSSTSLRITDQDGHVIGASNYQQVNTSFTPNATGDYYVTVSGNKGSTYTLVATAPTDDFGANATAAGKLAVDGSASGTLERSGDRDWFAIDMKAGATYEMSLKNAAGSALLSGSFYTQMNVVDAQGHVLARLDSNLNATGPQLSYRAAAAGTYYVEVAAGQPTGGYIVSAALGTPDDVGNQPADATRLDPGVAFSGMLAVPSDQDVFRVAVVAGQYYGFQLDHAPGAKMPNLQGTDARQTMLNVDTLRLSYSDSTYQVYLAKNTGDIYLTVDERPEYGANGYKLTATSLGSDDYGHYRDNANVASLAIGARLNGALNFAGDVDMLKVTLQQGESYQFDLLTSGSQGLNAKYSYGVSLYSANGTELVRSGGAFGWSFGYKAAGSGDYYLAVHANVTDINATGGYTLAASKMDAAPQLATPPATGAAAGIYHFLTLDFTEQIKVSDASGIVLRDAAGTEVGFDQSSAGRTVGTHLDLATQWHLAPGASYTLDIASNAIRDMAGNSFAGLHTTFTTVAAASAGTDGNDLLLGQSTGAAIHGGAGIDTAIYNNRKSQYNIVQHDGHAEISKLGGGKDILDGVERLSFQDKNIALDVNGVGGQAYRLYQAAFNRAPDLGGLGFWINAMDKGLSMMAAAGYFADSAEFQQLYGSNLSDDAYLTQLYSNVLHRTPDAGGKEFWLQALHNGTSRGDALGYFSDSAENQAALIGQISNGFEYIPAAG